MTIGEHSVTVYPDRSAGDWSPPVASNPYFAAGLQGWRSGPFGAAAVWTSDGRITVASGGLSRDQAYPVLRPVGVATYRVRATVAFDKSAYLTVGIYFGKTPADAWQGPFWAAPGAAKELKVVTFLPAGTHQVVFTWVAPSYGPEYAYVSPFVLNPTVSAAIPMVVDSLVLDYLTSGGVDMSCLVDEVTIHHGRDDPSSQPEPASATIDFTATPLDPLPTDVEIGAVVTVTTTTTAGASQRFLGRITDLTVGWEDAGEDTPDHGVGQLVATSLMADLGRRVVGDVPWAQELDGARISRIATAAGEALDPLWSDPGTVQIIARDVDSQAALDLARGVAEDAGGVFWHTRDGDVRYADADHRRGVQPSVELDVCDVLVTPTWSRTTDGLINEVSIGYGVEPEGGGEQARVHANNAASTARYGRYAYTAGTQLAALADATALANLLMVRNSTPVWIMSALPVDLAGLDDDTTSAVLALDMHSLVNLTGLPAIATAPTTALLWVEGWTEKLAWGVHELTLIVSGFCRTSPPPRWDDLSPAQTWDALDSSVTWDAVACLGPSTGGRWADVPASLRWSQVNPATTWNTWPSSRATTADLDDELADLTEHITERVS